MNKRPDRNFNSISRENNINAIRYYLAICILMNHFCVLTGIDVVQLPRIFGGAGSFFAISGFLMFPSFEKNSDVGRYLKRRANRIFPPYFLIVLAAACCGVFISSLPFTQYFTSSGFWEYLAANLTFLNWLHPDLPGVFAEATNRVSSVNGALWTMKGEVACYLTIPLIFWFSRKGNIRMQTILGWLMLMLGGLYLVFQYFYLEGNQKADIIARQCIVMFLFYMGGMLNMHLADVRRYWRSIMGICGCLLLFEFVNKYWLLLTIPYGGGFVFHNILIPLATGLMVIVCSVTGRWGSLLAGHEPVTYEIYLFHYPVIQTLVYLGVIDKIGFYPGLLTAIALTSLFAYLAYRYVGSRFTKH